MNHHCPAGDAYLYVNGEKLKIADMNSRAEHHPIVPVRVTLRIGDENEITFACEQYRDDIRELFQVGTTMM